MAAVFTMAANWLLIPIGLKAGFTVILFTWMFQVAGFAVEESTGTRPTGYMDTAFSALRRYEETGETKVKIDKLNEAQEAFGKAIKTAGDYAPAYRARGRFFHLYRKDLAAARADFERAVKLEPKNAANRLSLVLVLFEQAQWSNTVAASDELLRTIDQSDASEMRTYLVFHTRECRALSLLMLGRKEEAATEFDKINSLPEALRIENSGVALDAYPKLEGFGWNNRKSLMQYRLPILRLQHLEKDEVEWTALACDHLADRKMSSPQLGIEELQWLTPKLNALKPKSAEGWYGRAEVQRHKILLTSLYGGINKNDIAPTVADYDMAEKMGLTTPSMLFHRGQLLLEIGNEDRALADFEACFRSNTAVADIAYAEEAMERAIDLARKKGDKERLLRFLEYQWNHCVRKFRQTYYEERRQVLLDLGRHDEDTAASGSNTSISPTVVQLEGESFKEAERRRELQLLAVPSPSQVENLIHALASARLATAGVGLPDIPGPFGARANLDVAISLVPSRAEFLEARAKLSPTSVDDRLTIAMIKAKVAKLIKEEKLDLAAAAWKESVDSAPDRVNVHLARLEFLAAHAARLGADDHRLELVEVLKLLPDDQGSLKGNLCLERLRLLASLQLEEMVLIDEYRVYKVLLEAGLPSHETLGWLAFDLHDYPAATTHLSALLPDVEQELKECLIKARLEPENRSLRLAVDKARANVLRLKQQLRAIETITGNPQVALDHAKAADAYTVAGWPLAADADGAFALILEPNSVLLLCRKAGQAMAYDKFNEAPAHLDAALKLNPSSPEVYICRGALRQAECRFDEALADFDRAIQLSHCRPEPYFRRAQILFYRGEIEAAFEALATATLVEPPEYPLLLPQRLGPPTNSAPPASQRIASSGLHSVEVAVAQLKLARGDVEGAEEDLLRIGDDAPVWKRQLRAPRPETLPVQQPATYQNQQDWKKATKERQDQFQADQAAEWKARGGQLDWATSFTLGLARATRDEDQELLQYRERPLAPPSARAASIDPKMELAHWNFIAADIQLKEASAFADLIPSVEGPLAWKEDQRIEAEYRTLDRPFRHSPSFYYRSRLVAPLSSERNPQYHADKKFEAARDHILTPASVDDLYSILKGMTDKKNSGNTNFIDREFFGRNALEKLYDLRLLTLAKRADKLQASDYVDPILVSMGLYHSRDDALKLLRSALEESAKRQTEDARKREFADVITMVNKLIIR